MSVELVRAQSQDGLRLDGALQQPSQRTCTSVDAAILASGVGSNFYGSTLINTLSDALVDVGIATLRINTRGHDGISTASTPSGGRLQGAAYEIVDDCRLDLQAWIQYLVKRDYRQVALIGHSLGAIKVIYAQAYVPTASVHRVVAISPPKLSYEAFLTDDRASAFLSSLREAERLVQEQQPQALFQATFPFPLVISAGTYVDKYGAAERYNFCRFAQRVRAPLHFIFGQQELNNGGSAFQGLDTALRDIPWPSAAPTIQTIEGADHFYTGRLTKLVAAAVSIVREAEDE